MIAMFYTHLGTNVANLRSGAFTSGDFVDVLSHFPDAVLPERRKKRAYISSILSKNEVNREGPYNRKLFRRLKQGHYIINPQLSVWVEDGWRNIYDLLSLDLLGYQRRNENSFYYYFDPSEYMELRLQHFREKVKQLREGKEEEVLF
jgi:hypothetical protein